MAINTERLNNENQSGKGFGGSTRPNPSTPTTDTPADGGNEVALAITSTVQNQANQMVGIVQASEISIDHAADMFAEYLDEVTSGRRLLNRTMEKLQERRNQSPAIDISAEVPEVQVNLPFTRGAYGSSRQKFLEAFAPTRKALPNPFAQQPEAAE